MVCDIECGIYYFTCWSVLDGAMRQQRSCDGHMETSARSRGHCDLMATGRRPLRGREAAMTLQYPEYSRLLPCASHNQFPRIEHLVVLEEGFILDYISKALNLPPLFVADLVHFGAVHYALVCPKPPPTSTPEQFQIYKEVTEPSVLKKRSSIKGKTVREAQKTFRVTDANQFVEAGTYLRVHVHPKRFPRCYEIDWNSRIIAVTDTFVILDKPAATSALYFDAMWELGSHPLGKNIVDFEKANGDLAATVGLGSAAARCKRLKLASQWMVRGIIAYEVGGTADNIEECCATFASRALGFDAPLRTTHQIDNCTEGCVVFARTKDFCSEFHSMIREKQVRKLYRALAAAPVPIGIITHYMRPTNVAPRLVSEGLEP
ncbi:hypothetical protein ZIOFF_062685 [Zingiber officinale]|uniref:Pseudouridine synthase RsuA/RluA-like domain-containing protein n=1 Tax=Zingiber officinale TaxID=94328 RepID=A0A8J5F164_ZINOF|nr:hypothetical protein ZIOFF_062685 [Zingiber officinale]